MGPVVKGRSSWKWITVSVGGVVVAIAGALSLVFWQLRPVAPRSIASDSTPLVGEINLQSTPLSEIRIRFNSGDIKVRVSDELQISWQCRVKGERRSLLHSLEGKVMTLALSENTAADCEITVPQGIRTLVEGPNSRVAQGDHPVNISTMNGTNDGSTAGL
jgi:hypothetical protein